jgi:hypothetical protein
MSKTYRNAPHSHQHHNWIDKVEKKRNKMNPTEFDDGTFKIDKPEFNKGAHDGVGFDEVWTQDAKKFRKKHLNRRQRRQNWENDFPY